MMGGARRALIRSVRAIALRASRHRSAIVRRASATRVEGIAPIASVTRRRLRNPIMRSVVYRIIDLTIN
jgi:hypothetical protein